jgi:hypothetical protein
LRLALSIHFNDLVVDVLKTPRICRVERAEEIARVREADLQPLLANAEHHISIIERHSPHQGEPS